RLLRSSGSLSAACSARNGGSGGGSNAAQPLGGLRADLNDMAALGQRHLGLRQRVAAADLNQPIGQRVLPNGMTWTCTPPRLHRFGISPPPARNPGEKLDHQ